MNLLDADRVFEDHPFSSISGQSLASM
jgi:hypothetical protein